MENRPVATIFAQIIAGEDTLDPETLRSINQDEATTKVGPYTILEILWHANYWQSLWLDRLNGRPLPTQEEIDANDFKTSAPDEWDDLRNKFIAGLKEAHQIAGSHPFTHHAPSDEIAIDRLGRIAVHTSYHLGQINLLHRILQGKTPSDE